MDRTRYNIKPSIFCNGYVLVDNERQYTFPRTAHRGAIKQYQRVLNIQNQKIKQLEQDKRRFVNYFRRSTDWDDEEIKEIILDNDYYDTVWWEKL